MVTSLSIGNGGLGRFGNQLWTIAGVIGIAKRNNTSFAFPKWINRDNALFGDFADVLVIHKNQFIAIEIGMHEEYE